MKYAIALDIGGTKIEGVLFNERYRPLKKVRSYFKKDASKLTVNLPRKMITDMIDDVITQVKTGKSIAGVGISIPDVITPDGALGSEAKIRSLRNFNLPKYIKKTHGVKCEIKNDADCFALGEFAAGAGKGSTNMLGVIWGTGIGSGIIINKKLYLSTRGSAGEFGHNVVDPLGRKCRCGGVGHIEAYSAGPSVISRYKELGGKKDGNPSTIFKSTERAAKRSISEAIDVLGIGLAAYVNILDPDVIVMGGGLSNMSAYRQLTTAVKKYCRPEYMKHVKIVRNKLGDSAGVYGAAKLVFG